MRLSNLIPVLYLVLSSVPAYAVTEYESVELVKAFADGFLTPTNGEIAHKGNSTLFAEDVKGSIDIAGDFDGRELATEYMFGLFARAAENPDIPSFVGTPVAYNVTSLAVQRNFVTASIKVDYHYKMIKETYPIELGAWFAVNEQGQIFQYDITFKRWAWAMDEILPKMLPHMASWANSNSTNPTTILRTYLARTICGTSLLSCTGPNQQWSTVAECTAFINATETGQFYRMGENNLACRAVHAALVPFRPSFHCAAMGPRSTRCVARNYAGTVKADHFPEGFLAPKVVTPENEDEIGDYQVINGVPITPLLKISLNQDSLKSWDPTLFATATFVYMLILWVNAKALYLGYSRFSKRFRALPTEVLKINVVMYVMNIFYTFVAVALQAVAIPAFWRDYHLYQVLCVRTAAIMICGLYCFELVFRFDMRLPLIAHHFFTIFAVCFCVTLFEITQDMTFLLSGSIWLCQATTEQPTFFALYGYRMRWSPVFLSNLLKAASIQTFIFKIASAVGVIVVWVINQRSTFRAIDAAWSAMVFTISIGLMATQVWGSWITWKLGVRVMNKHRKGQLANHDPRGATHEFKLLSTPPEETEDPYARLTNSVDGKVLPIGKKGYDRTPAMARSVSSLSQFSDSPPLLGKSPNPSAYDILEPYSDPFEYPSLPRWGREGYAYDSGRDSIYDPTPVGSRRGSAAPSRSPSPTRGAPTTIVVSDSSGVPGIPRYTADASSGGEQSGLLTPPRLPPRPRHNSGPSSSRHHATSSLDAGARLVVPTEDRPRGRRVETEVEWGRRSGPERIDVGHVRNHSR